MRCGNFSAAASTKGSHDCGPTATFRVRLRTGDQRFAVPCRRCSAASAFQRSQVLGTAKPSDPRTPFGLRALFLLAAPLLSLPLTVVDLARSSSVLKSPRTVELLTAQSHGLAWKKVTWARVFRASMVVVMDLLRASCRKLLSIMLETI